jgi:hypothetical protein
MTDSSYQGTLLIVDDTPTNLKNAVFLFARIWFQSAGG